MLAFLEQYIMQARFLHISYPEHVHRQGTLKGVGWFLKAGFPVSLSSLPIQEETLGEQGRPKG